LTVIEVPTRIDRAQRRIRVHAQRFRESPRSGEAPRGMAGAVASRMDVMIPIRGIDLAGALTVPADASGVVLFAHGTGSSRNSSRDERIARAFEDRGLATLRFDLVTPAEQEKDALVTELHDDVAFLADRLIDATDWVRTLPRLSALPVAYVGTGTGAAAALIAAARRHEVVRAVVSRGGRPDLAGDWLARVRAPVLLVVGGADETLAAVNRDARAQLGPTSELVLVPGASALFEEPGALDAVAHLAADWIGTHVSRERGASRRAAGDPIC
jgi:putative phosphoribosyl transferase